jgi:hypothetical protein
MCISIFPQHRSNCFQAQHKENRKIARNSTPEHPVHAGKWSRLEREELPADPSQFGHENQIFPHNQPNLNMQYQNENAADFTWAAAGGSTRTVSPNDQQDDVSVQEFARPADIPAPAVIGNQPNLHAQRPLATRHPPMVPTGNERAMPHFTDTPEGHQIIVSILQHARNSPEWFGRTLAHAYRMEHFCQLALSEFGEDGIFQGYNVVSHTQL